MDFSDAPEQAELRAELRAWLKVNVDPDWRARFPAHDTRAMREYLCDWQQRLFQAGFMGLSWPVEYGGRGLGPVDEQVFAEEMGRVGAPPVVNVGGVYMVGPALINYGTAPQRARYLARILSAEEIWCQGYSEPNAGSDLASLSTRAEAQPDGSFLVSGQKIWTSSAQIADRCFLLARTDPASSRRDGISCLMVDMHQPGIDVRPIVDMAGANHFNEVFFDYVPVAADEICGPLHAGWRVATSILSLERRLPARGRGPFPEMVLRGTLGLAVAHRDRLGAGDITRIGAVVGGFYANRLLRYRNLSLIAEGKFAGPESSLEKLSWDHLVYDMHQVGLDILGPEGVLPPDQAEAEWLAGALDAPSHMIAGGTTEIQKNTIAERLLGLPRE